MLVEHLANLEERLKAWTDAEARTASERLAVEFCRPMFGSELIVATGRVVDCNSKPESPHAVADILLCRSHGPRLEIGGLGDCMLAESVVAAITVVPGLDSETMSTAVAGARAMKALRRSALLPLGAWVTEPPMQGQADEVTQSITCLVVAFDGPKDMEQAHIWLKSAYRTQGIDEPDMPDAGAERQLIASPALDGVFVLGRGHLNFDNMAISMFNDESRAQCFGACWSIASAAQGSLLSLYLQINQAATAMAGTRLDPRPYLRETVGAVVRLGS